MKAGLICELLWKHCCAKQVARYVSHVRSQEGQEVVPVHFGLKVPALGTCSWQRCEHGSLHFHFVGEVFGEGRQRASLVSIHVYAAVWLLSKDERGIR